MRQYIASLLKQRDKNNNGVLEREEWSQMQSRWHVADRNGDGIITLDELTAFVLDRFRRGSETPRPPFPAEFPSVGGRPFFGGPPPGSPLPGGTDKPLDPRALMVALRVLVVELAPDADAKSSPLAAPPTSGSRKPDAKSSLPGQPAARPLSADKEKPGGIVEIDLAASNEKLKADLGKMGLRGRWESFRRLQLAGVDGQVVSLNIGGREPMIHGSTITQFGRGNSIQYYNTGFIIAAQPHVDPGGIITVDLTVETARLGGEDDAIPISASSQGETIAAHPLHQASSRNTVRIPDGKTVMVAGASREAGGRRRELVILLSAQVIQLKTH
jgi:hypothetical protein